MDRFFSLFGKLVLVLFVVGLLLAGGYYLGKKYTLLQQVPQQISISPAPTSATKNGSISPTGIQQNPQATGRFVVTGGGASATSFSKARYTLSGIAGWTPTTTDNPGFNKVVLTKGDYQLSILQTALGGGGCTFPGEQPQQMSITLTAPVAEITLLDNTVLKRGQADSANNPGKQTYDVCQKEQDGIFGNITYFGVITYTVPLNPNAQTVAEMDAMVGSLQKQ